jgi:hypothetical protein
MFVFWTTCGSGSQDPTALLIALLVFCMTAIAYFTHSVVAIIFTLMGYRFENRLIYPFIRSE